MRQRVRDEYFVLGNQSLFAMQVSDHKPLLNRDKLSWNVMMQGRLGRHGYNNAFKLQEDKSAYQHRLSLIVAVLAEIVATSSVGVICLQEAPIDAVDVAFFANEFKRHDVLSGFLPMFDDAACVTQWGIMTLIDLGQYKYQHQPTVWTQRLSVFNDRLQRLRIEANGHSEVILNVHMPYRETRGAAGEDYVRQIIMGVVYIDAMSQFPVQHILSGDFNVHPKGLRIDDASCFFKEGNSIHLDDKEQRFSETVDAIFSSSA